MTQFEVLKKKVTVSPYLNLSEHSTKNISQVNGQPSFASVKDIAGLSWLAKVALGHFSLDIVGRCHLYAHTVGP